MDRQVAHLGGKRDSYTFSVGKSKGSRSFEKSKNRREDQYKIRYSRKSIGGRGLYRFTSGQADMLGYCANGNETLGSMIFGTFLNQLQNYRLFKKDTPSWNLLRLLHNDPEERRPQFPIHLSSCSSNLTSYLNISHHQPTFLSINSLA